MDVYVFVRTAGQETIDALYGVKGVRHVAKLLTGAFDAVVFGEAADEQELEAFMSQVRGTAGGDLDKALVIAEPPPGGEGTNEVAPRRWIGPARFVSHTRVRVEGGRSGHVLEAALESEYVRGASVVAGSFDLLINVAGNTMDEVRQGLLELNSIQGIAWTDSSIEVVRLDSTI